jgi:arginine-tRNA-protein transferase
MNYLHWQEKTVTDLSEKNISALYNDGFVFTRIGKGVMHQTRSVRIDLSKFEPSSENRRILKKVENLTLSVAKVPYTDYAFGIGKLGKDFYEKKFGGGVMSASKIKEILTDTDRSNFNSLLVFSDTHGPIGYAICYLNDEVMHYSYPFYDLDKSPKDMGLGMMTKAIVYAKEKGLKYIYLGSLQRPTDTYKLQFSGLEWFDGEKWSTDTETVREILKRGE